MYKQAGNMVVGLDRVVINLVGSIPPQLVDDYVVLKANRKIELSDEDVKTIYAFCHCVAGLITSLILKITMRNHGNPFLAHDIFNSYVKVFIMTDYINDWVKSISNDKRFKKIHNEFKDKLISTGLGIDALTIMKGLSIKDLTKAIKKVGDRGEPKVIT